MADYILNEESIRNPEVRKEIERLLKLHNKTIKNKIINYRNYEPETMACIAEKIGLTTREAKSWIMSYRYLFDRETKIVGVEMVNKDGMLIGRTTAKRVFYKTVN